VNIKLIIEAREAVKKRNGLEIFLMKTFGKKIYLCHEGPEKHETWTGSLPLYLFWCRECEHWAKDYPHGFIEKRCLHCSNCNYRHSFIPLKVQLRIVYELFQRARQIRALKKQHGNGINR